MIAVVTGTRAVIAAVGVALVLGVAACSGDDPEPRVAPPSSSPPRTSAASGPIAPTMPPEAMGTDAAAAEAFVKFYWEMVNYAQATGDVEGLDEIADPHCEACQGGLKTLRGIFEHGGRIEGGENSVSDLRSSLAKDGDRATVWLEVTNTRQTVDFPGEAEDQIYRGSHLSLVSVVRRDGDHWLLEYWDEDK